MSSGWFKLTKDVKMATYRRGEDEKGYDNEWDSDEERDTEEEGTDFEDVGEDGQPRPKAKPKEEEPESKLQWIMRKIWQTELTKDGKLGKQSTCFWSFCTFFGFFH